MRKQRPKEKKSIAPKCYTEKGETTMFPPCSCGSGAKAHSVPSCQKVLQPAWGTKKPLLNSVPFTSSANSVISILALTYSQKWVTKLLWKAATVIFAIRESRTHLPHDCEEMLLSCYLFLSLAESVNACYSGTESLSAAPGFTLTFAYPFAYIFMPIII